MPVELNITDTAVILESASEPGPAGPGVPTGGTVGQVLTKDSSTDYDTSWQDQTGGGGGGAPTTVDYLVGTASGSLSAEIVVGTSPGGELGGTWASPTVDTTHSGSSHASVQAAAEATAAAALSAHLTDTTDAHDASAISSVAAGNLAATDVQAALNELDSEKAASTHVHAGEDITSGTVADARIASTIARDSEVTSAISTSEAGQVRDGDAAGGVLGGTYPNPSFAADMATQAELDAHINDTSAAHAASAVSVSSTTLSGTGTDVQAVFEEIDNLLDDHSSRHENGGADEISIAGLSGMPEALATGKLFLSAAGMWPSTTSGCATNTKTEYTTNDVDMYGLAFDQTAQEFAQATVAMPSDWNGGTVTAQFYWTKVGTSTNSVVWQLAGTSFGDLENIDAAWGTAQEVTDAGSASTNQVHISSATSAITLAGTPAAGELVQFRVSRDPADGNDTLAADAILLGVMITFTRA